MDNHSDHFMAKWASALAGWVTAGWASHTWHDISSFVVTIYTLILIGDYFWKRFIRKSRDTNVPDTDKAPL